MINCNKFYINYDLYDKVNNLSNPCNTNWLTEFKFLNKGKYGTIYSSQILLKNIPNLLDYYIIKSIPLNNNSIREKNIMKIISNDMYKNLAPLLFPFLYYDYVCQNNLYLLMNPSIITFKDILLQKYSLSIEWWSQILYQLSKAIFYLEEKFINHNDLTLDNIMFQHFSINPNDNAIMIIDFGSAVLHHDKHSNLPSFTLGRDLNYFLYYFISKGLAENFFPKNLANLLFPLIYFQNIPRLSLDNPFTYGLRQVNITNHNWKTSGKNISQLLSKYYPTVTDLCNPKRYNKLLGVAFGAILGDCLGMPIKFDNNFNSTITDFYSSNKFKGIFSKFNLPSFTFTDNTQISLSIIDSILKDNRQVIPTTIAKNLKLWFDNNPIYIDNYLSSILKQFNKDSNNWKKVVNDVYLLNQNSSNICSFRTWSIPILYHSLHYSNVIDATIIQSKITNIDNDTIYSAVFISCLIHFLINNFDLLYAFNKSLSIVKKFISPILYNIILNSHLQDYNKLNSYDTSIFNTMAIVIWSIRNTNNFTDAIFKAVNIKGDTNTNASITGAIAGALYGFDNIPEKWIDNFNKSNNFNYWNGKQVNFDYIKNFVSSLSLC